MPKKILVVDDDNGLRYMLQKRLEHMGYECKATATAEYALACLKQLQPDLIILDLGLLNTDGTAVLKHLGEWLPKGAHLPKVLILSGHNDGEIVEYCLKNGACGFLHKPVDFKRLAAIVHQYIH